MDFNIKNLVRNTTNELTASFNDAVTKVQYELKETNGSFTSSLDFTQILIRPNSSSFVNYNSLNENQVKGWVTSSYETLNCSYGKKGVNGWVNFSTASWAEFQNTVQSFLIEEISSSMEQNVDDGIPW